MMSKIAGDRLTIIIFKFTELVKLCMTLTGVRLFILYNVMYKRQFAGDNVGKNEFSGDFMSAYFYGASELFVVSASSSDNVIEAFSSGDVIEAFIAIHPCVYARGYDTCLAGVRVIRSQVCRISVVWSLG